MFLIAGLGNPGKEYENTRHNAGFMVLDALADKLGADISEKKHKALCGRAVIGGQKVILLKPQTYMNSSGESIRAAADYYKVDPEDILVVYDDISLAPGQLRIRAKGSAGGHNGIKSIIAHLGTQEFPRVRVGVGEKPPRTFPLVQKIQGERTRLAFTGQQLVAAADNEGKTRNPLDAFIGAGNKEIDPPLCHRNLHSSKG